MTLQRDVERNESKYLHEFADFTKKRVLEVGAGEGRMIWQYAKTSQVTIGIDPDMEALRIAKIDRPADLERQVLMSCAASEYLPFSKETFDIAVLAWSL